MSYYINSTGGITGFGDKNAIIVVYANGIVVPNSFSIPQVPEGSTIIVKKTQRSIISLSLQQIGHDTFIFSHCVGFKSQMQ